MTDPVPVGPVDIEDAMPPTDPKVIYLGGLFFLALAAALYVAAEIVGPLIFAFMLSRGDGLSDCRAGWET